MKKAIQFISICLLLFSLSAYAERVKVMAVKDGDTFYVQDGREVRLPGIDCPELSQPFGAEARNAAIELIERKEVEIDCTDDCTYGRFLCKTTVPLGGSAEALDLQKELVRRGMAYDYLKYSGGLYHDDETYAKERGYGVWGQPDGGMRPWDYRRQPNERKCRTKR